jgi:acyl carrier protein
MSTIDVSALLQEEFSLDKRPEPDDDLWLDLRLDSLSSVELLALIEDVLDREIADDVLATWQTVGDLQLSIDAVT